MTNFPNLPLGQSTVTAVCPAGKVLVGGGYGTLDGVTLAIRSIGTSVFSPTNTFQATVDNNAFSGVRAYVIANCVNAT